jgi:hypothetical protein
MMNRDYSDDTDPYGINGEYTVQSADQDVGRTARGPQSGGTDVRGNLTLPARGVPTQQEADVIKKEM